MTQITQEELVGLLEDVRPYIQLVNGGGALLDRINNAVVNLQAAEPVAWIGEEELGGLAMHRRNDFPAGAMVLATKSGSAKFPLFTLPCPPANSRGNDGQTDMVAAVTRPVQGVEE